MATWDINEQYDGLHTLTENDYEPFVDWDRDAFRYPLNKNVWKMDKNNNGFPWISNLPYDKMGRMLIYRLNVNNGEE
jgi:hypothetical protein